MEDSQSMPSRSEAIDTRRRQATYKGFLLRLSCGADNRKWVCHALVPAEIYRLGVLGRGVHAGDSIEEAIASSMEWVDNILDSQIAEHEAALETLRKAQALPAEASPPEFF